MFKKIFLLKSCISQKNKKKMFISYAWRRLMLLLAVGIHVTSFKQLECFIKAWHLCTNLKFVMTAGF